MLTTKAQMLPDKSKACIYLKMEVWPIHIDTFDPKPKLAELHMKEFVRESKFASAMSSGKRYFVQSPFKFRKAGRAGVEICENFVHLAECADDLCIYRGAQAESVNHPTALYHLNTGNQFGGDPAIGAWVTYGLGTVNENLPAFVVLPEINFPQGGSANWSNGFLPAQYQATPLRPVGSPILDLNPPPGVTREEQRKNLDLMAELNRLHQQKYPGHEDLPARLEAYELAFRMQSEIPEIIDLGKESDETRALYGIDEKETDGFARRCLLPRRLVEQAVEVAHPLKNLHCTILRLLGLDDNKLTYFHAGRFKQLSQTGGQMIKELIA